MGAVGEQLSFLQLMRLCIGCRRCMSLSSATSNLLQHSFSGNSQPPSPRGGSATASGGGSAEAAAPKTSLLSGLATRLAAFAHPAAEPKAQGEQPAPGSEAQSPRSSPGSGAAVPAADSQLVMSAAPPSAAAASAVASATGLPVYQLRTADGRSGGHAGASHPSKQQRRLEVTEAALRYGQHMLGRTGGKLRSNVQVDNVYERRLLAGGPPSPVLLVSYLPHFIR